MTWQPIATAPKDGTRMLWAGTYKPFDMLDGGEWHQEIFTWGSMMSDGSGYKWIGPGFASPDHWNIEWKSWQPLPEDPVDD